MQGGPGNSTCPAPGPSNPAPPSLFTTLPEPHFSSSLAFVGQFQGSNRLAMLGGESQSGYSSNPELKSSGSVIAGNRQKKKAFSSLPSQPTQLPEPGTNAGAAQFASQSLGRELPPLQRSARGGARGRRRPSRSCPRGRGRGKAGAAL